LDWKAKVIILKTQGTKGRLNLTSLRLIGSFLELGRNYSFLGKETLGFIGRN